MVRKEEKQKYSLPLVLEAKGRRYFNIFLGIYNCHMHANKKLRNPKLSPLANLEVLCK